MKTGRTKFEMDQYIAEAKADSVVEDIAKRIGIKTLKTRNSDSLDFHDIPVWSLKAALIAAYEAGRSAKKGK